MTTDWSIQQLARAAGTTSRTLRHYGDLGLLPPSRVGANGYRYYDADALTRLQRILLLRELGLGLPAIGEIVRGNSDNVSALTTHVAVLEAERDRIDRQLASVRSTIDNLTEGKKLMPTTMFDGFDHTAHKREVIERWGEQAYASGEAWWHAKTEAERTAFHRDAAQLAADWTAAAVSGIDPASDEAQRLARRQHDWLVGIPGTPPMSAEHLTALGAMYETDERFAANYGGLDGARFVHRALAVFAAANL